MADEGLTIPVEVVGDAKARLADIKAGLDMLEGAFNRVVSAAEGIANLSAEAENLARNSARLGLDFDQAAGAAGRFTDEVDVMNVSSRFAEAGLRLTQDELDQLSRRAAIFSQNTGVDMRQSFDQLFGAIESGSTRALRPFGENMLSLAGSSHTAREVLNAFVSETRGMSTATDNAATSLAALWDQLDDTKRTIASEATRQFAAMWAAQDSLTSSTRDANAALGDTQAKLQAIGDTIAHVGMFVMSSAQLIAGGIGTAFLAPATLMRTFFSAMAKGLHGDFAGAVTELSNFGSVGALGQAARFADEGVTNFRNLVSGRTEQEAQRIRNAEAEARGAATQQARSRAGGGSRRRPGGGGGGGGDERGALWRTSMTFSEEEIRQADANDAAKAAEQRRIDELMSSGPDKTTSRDKELAGQRMDELARSMTDEARLRDRAAQADVDRETRRLDRLYQANRSFTSRMGDLFEERKSTTEMAAESVGNAYRSMTDSMGKHLAAAMLGKETIGEALKGMLSDTLAAITQEAAVKAIMSVANGIAAAASYRYAEAGQYFAAAAAYAAVGVAAGLASQAIAPPAKAQPSAAANDNARADRPASATRGGRSTEGGATIVNITYGGGVLSTPRDLARHVAGVLNQGVVQGRITIDPRLVGAA